MGSWHTIPAHLIIIMRLELQHTDSHPNERVQGAGVVRGRKDSNQTCRFTYN